MSALSLSFHTTIGPNIKVVCLSYRTQRKYGVALQSRNTNGSAYTLVQLFTVQNYTYSISLKQGGWQFQVP